MWTRNTKRLSETIPAKLPINKRVFHPSRPNVNPWIVMNRSLRCKQFLFKFFSIDWYLKGIKMFYHLWASTGGHFCIYILSIFWTEPKSEISDRCTESTGVNRGAQEFSLHRTALINAYITLNYLFNLYCLQSANLHTIN